MKLKKVKQRGLTLIELLLAVGIISIAMMGILEFISKEAEAKRAKLAGEQISMVGKAVEKMLTLEGSNLRSCIPEGTNILLPLTALINSTGTTQVGSCTITNRPLISWNAAASGTPLPVNVFGPGYTITVRNATGGYVTGLVTLDAPVREGNMGNVIKYNWLGMSAKAIGANGGGTFATTPGRMQGVGGGWSIVEADFPAVRDLGILGYKTTVGGELDNIYLRLDGAYPMRGDLNLGNFSINNVTDLNINGWINGNNALLNNLKVGYISAQHIQTHGLNATSYITTAGSDPNIRPVGWSGGLMKSWDIIAQSSLGVTSFNGAGGGADTPVLEVLLSQEGLLAGSGFQFNGRGNNSHFGSGRYANQYTRDGRLAYTGYLADRLPRYVLRGVFAANNGERIRKPDCNAAAYSLDPTTNPAVIAQNSRNAAKIIVTPQFNNTYPEYETLLQLVDRGRNGFDINLIRSTTARDQIQVYAIDNGSEWTIRSTSLVGDRPQYGITELKGRALVQTFCDFGD